MKNKIVWLFSLLIVASLVLAACGGGATPDEPAAEQPVAEEPVVEEPSSGGVQIPEAVEGKVFSQFSASLRRATNTTGFKDFDVPGAVDAGRHVEDVSDSDPCIRGASQLRDIGFDALIDLDLPPTLKDADDGGDQHLGHRPVDGSA